MLEGFNPNTSWVFCEIGQIIESTLIGNLKKGKIMHNKIQVVFHFSLWY